jgi:hypothetical protein
MPTRHGHTKNSINFELARTASTAKRLNFAFFGIEGAWEESAERVGYARI